MSLISCKGGPGGFELETLTVGSTIAGIWIAADALPDSAAIPLRLRAIPRDPSLSIAISP